MWDPYAEFETAVLPNGLTIHCAHWPNRPWVHCGFVVHAGHDLDPLGKEGVAHFVEHMVSHNAGVPSQDVDDFFKRHGGGSMLGATSISATRFGFFAPIEPSVLSRAFELFGTMLFSKTLEHRMEEERKIILQEFFRYYPNAMNYKRTVRFHRKMYGETFFGRMPSGVGDPTTIERIQAEDVQDFYATHYVPANIQVVCVGGLAMSDLKRLIEASALAQEKKGVRSSPITPIESFVDFEKSRFVRWRLKTHTPISTDVSSYFSTARIPNSVSEAHLSIFCGMLRARLNAILREQHQWIYGCSIDCKDIGPFQTCEIQAKGLLHKNLKAFEKAIEEIFRDLKNYQELFESVKRECVMSTQMVDLSGGRICVCAAEELGMNRRISTLSEFVAAHSSVTFEEVLEILPLFTKKKRLTRIIYQ